MAPAGANKGQIGFIPEAQEAGTEVMPAVEMSGRFVPADDLNLVARTLAGDKQAFEALVGQHEGRVFAWRSLSATTARTPRKPCKTRLSRPISIWLTSIAINEALQRRNQREEGRSQQRRQVEGNKLGSMM